MFSKTKSIQRNETELLAPVSLNKGQNPLQINFKNLLKLKFDHMRTIGYSLLFFLSVSFLFPVKSCAADTQKGHDITIKVDGLSNKQCLLAYYFGDEKYIKDTLQLDAQGKVNLSGDEPMDGGIYMFVFPGNKNYFEFIINEQEFTLSTTKANPVKNMTIQGSSENKMFFEYMSMLNKKKSKAQKLKKKRKSIKDENPEKAEKIQDQIDNIGETIKKKRSKLIDENEDLFYTKVLKTMEDPEYPSIKGEDGKVDSQKSFNVYKQRYFNNVDWSDDRLLRTPIYHNKLTTYLEDLTPRNPDSIIAAADQLVKATEGNDETFKYIVHHITSKYERSKIMGMDKVFVHMGENYYLTGKADWVSDEQLKDIKERVLRLKPNLIGKQAPRITMANINDEPVSLYDVDKPITVLFFWDSECGACQSAIPKLRKIYKNAEFSDKMEVYAVNIEDKKDGWVEYVNNNELPWINVQDRYNDSKFRAYYNIYSTPVIYVLDDKKKIRAKRIGVEQLKKVVPDILDGKTQSGNRKQKGKNKDQG